MRNRPSLADSDDLTEINISPLIDLVFILLIFFIVTTVFVEEVGVDVERPQPAAANELDNEIIQIRVTARNQVIYDGREIGVGGVRAQVNRLNLKQRLPVIINADEKASAGVVVRVIDECKLGNAKSVSLAADRPRS